MRKLYAAYEGDHRAIVEESGEDAEILALYNGSKEAGTFKGRRVHAMWVVDDQDDVIRTYGSVPTEIDARHAAWREGRKQRAP